MFPLLTENLPEPAKPYYTGEQLSCASDSHSQIRREKEREVRWGWTKRLHANCLCYGRLLSSPPELFPIILPQVISDLYLLRYLG